MEDKLVPPIVIIKRAWTLLLHPANLGFYLFFGVVLGFLFGLIGEVLQKTGPAIGVFLFTFFTKHLGMFGGLVTFFLISLGLLVSGLVWSWREVLLYSYHVDAIAGTKRTFGEYSSHARKRAGNYLIAYVFLFLAIGSGFVLLVIPGLLLLVWYQFVPIIVAIEHNSVSEFKASKALVQWKFWPIAGRTIVYVLIFLIPYLVFSKIHSLLAFIWYAFPFSGLMTTLFYIESKNAYWRSHPAQPAPTPQAT